MGEFRLSELGYHYSCRCQAAPPPASTLVSAVPPSGPHSPPASFPCHTSEIWLLGCDHISNGETARIRESLKRLWPTPYHYFKLVFCFGEEVMFKTNNTRKIRGLSRNSPAIVNTTKMVCTTLL